MIALALAVVVAAQTAPADACAKLKALPLKLDVSIEVHAPTFARTHIDDVIARCAPAASTGAAFTGALKVRASPMLGDPPAYGDVDVYAVDAKWGDVVGRADERLAAPFDQRSLDAMFDRALASFVDAATASAATKAARDAEDDKRCRAVSAAPVALSVDAPDDDASRLVVDTIVTRMQLRCMKLTQTKEQIGFRYGLTLHVAMIETTKQELLLAGTKMKSYGVTVDLKLVDVAARTIIAAVGESGRAAGLDPPGAVKQLASRAATGGDKVLAPAADEVARRFALALTTP